MEYLVPHVAHYTEVLTVILKSCSQLKQLLANKAINAQQELSNDIDKIGNIVIA